MNIKTRNERIEDLESTVQVLSEKVSSLEQLSRVSADVLANLGHLLNFQINKSNELSNLLFTLINLVAARTGLSASDVLQELKGVACGSETPTVTSTAIFSFLQGSRWFGKQERSHQARKLFRLGCLEPFITGNLVLRGQSKRISERMKVDGS